MTAPINFNPINIHNALQALGFAKIFSILDLASGFWQVPLDPKNRHKTALMCRAGGVPVQRHAFRFGECPG
jgi:hypothetical protein